MIMASQKGHADVVRLLLEAGAMPDMPDFNNYPGPLAYVAGASVSPEPSLQPDTVLGGIPIMKMSARGKYGRIGRLLLEAGADPNAGFGGETCLTLAAKADNAELLETLVTHGADLEARNEEGFTALEAAITEGCVGAVHALLKVDAARAERSLKKKELNQMAKDCGNRAIANLLRHFAESDPDSGN